MGVDETGYGVCLVLGFGVSGVGALAFCYQRLTLIC
jgi:hypothetical protein